MTQTAQTVQATQPTAHKTAIIDVGGGYRAIFGAGVLDRCLEDGITFDSCYGVSAGSANLTSFLAGQHGRNHTFYTVSLLYTGVCMMFFTVWPGETTED